MSPATAADDDKALLKQLAAMIEDENLIVTYKTLSRRMSLPVNRSKELLALYLATLRAKYPGVVTAVYTLIAPVTAIPGDPLGPEEQIILVRDVNLSEWQARLPTAVKQVYSVQAMVVEDSATLHMADNPVDQEAVRGLLSTTAIQCDYVGPRGKSVVAAKTSSSSSFTAPTISGNGLKKLEADAGHVMAKIGLSVEALQVKAKPATVAPPPAAQPVKKKSAVASWVKSGPAGMDPKRSAAVKNIFSVKKKEAKTAEKPAGNEDGDDDEEDFWPKKAKGSAVKAAVKDSDDDDEMEPSGPTDNVVDEDVEMELPASKNQTMMLADSSVEQQRSPSPEDAPVVIVRRKSIKAVVMDSHEEEEIPVPAKRVVTTTFNALSNVSSDEEEQEKRTKKTAPPPKKTKLTTQPKKSLDSNDDGEEVVLAPSPSTGKPKGKWGFSVEEEDEDEYQVSEPRNVVIFTPKTRASGGTKRGKKFTTTESGEEEESPAVKTRKPRKKAKWNDSDEEGDGGKEEDVVRMRTPSPQPMRQYLAPVAAASATTSGKQRKQVIKTSIDAEGYEVSEKVWVNVDSGDEEEVENAAIDKVADPPKEVKKTSAGAASKPAVAAKTAGKKGSATAAAAGKGKGAQSSIMSFFKKA
ncbi:hypothetical protein BV898_06679 [Hypsibius exemplaris]|uniref:DNA polymerase delta subunit 3 n=1 Tax=Hypsibius exemplaris TaxID=2072580 RepID=A0A1W0WVN4_HYPEX|nr:hypothetical protein BV898_06679 [Hypsibius exemplaris]